MSPKRHRTSHLVETLGGVSVALYAPVGVLTFVIRMLGGYAVRLEQDWLWLWPVSLLPLAILEAAVGHIEASLSWVGEAAIALVASALMRGERRSVGRGLLIGLAVLTTIMVLTQFNANRLWLNSPDADAAFKLARLIATGTQTVNAASEHSWTIPKGTSRVTLRTVLRDARGSWAWAWRTHGPVEIRPLASAGPSAARIRFGSGDDPYVMRWFDQPVPIAGKRFRVTLEARSDSPVLPGGCRGISLQAWGHGGGTSCQSLVLSSSWQSFHYEWTPPPTAQTHDLRIVLKGTTGQVIDVRKVQLFEYSADGWKKLGPLAPAAVTVQFEWIQPHGTQTRVLAAAPGKSWQTISASLKGLPSKSVSRVSVSLAPTGQSAVTVGPTIVRAGDQELRAAGTPLRQSAWFGHPNLAGHSIASLALGLLLIATSLRVRLAAFALTAVAIYLTGSRTAFVAAIAGMALLILLSHRRARKFLVPLMVLLTFTVLLVIGSTLLRDPVGRLTFDRVHSNVPRLAIWKGALDAFEAHPLFGLAGAGKTFASYWETAKPDPNHVPITHAHNLWLELASNYGVVGLSCGLWLTLGLLTVGWRRARAPGLVLVTSVLLMNVVDYTLLYSGVLLPLILALNVADKRARTPERTDPPGSRRHHKQAERLADPDAR